MALASLLALPRNQREAYGFVFDHDQEQRSMFTALDPSVGNPPILDPAPIKATAERAGVWHYNHHHAHEDFSIGAFGYRLTQNMADATFAEKSSLSWWTFVNHHEHYLINQIP